MDLQKHAETEQSDKLQPMQLVFALVERAKHNALMRHLETSCPGSAAGARRRGRDGAAGRAVLRRDAARRPRDDVAPPLAQLPLGRLDARLRLQGHLVHR